MRNYVWRNKWITSEAKSIEDFIKAYEHALEVLRRWKQLDIKLEQNSGIMDDYAEFFTYDKENAEKEGFS